MKDETKIELIKELSKGNVTIKQLIMEVNGTLNYYENQEENGKKTVSDKQISNAIIAISGEDKPLNEQQLYLGVICVLLSKYGWSGNWADCCTRINKLPMKDMFQKRCEYNSIKVLTAYKFAGVNYKEWDKYEPTKTENTIFKKCKAVADAFEEAISLPLG